MEKNKRRERERERERDNKYYRIDEDSKDT
jgi:hypothetical protein